MMAEDHRSKAAPDKRHRGKARQAGFTLLEIIVTIIVAAIMGVFMVQFLGTAVIHSVDPLVRVQNASSVNQIMEYMTADYKKLASTQQSFLSTFKDYVTNGRLSAGRPAGYPYYGDYTILCNKYVTFDAHDAQHYWQQNDGNQVSGQMLKVTIRLGDQTATALFTR